MLLTLCRPSRRCDILKGRRHTDHKRYSPKGQFGCPNTPPGLGRRANAPPGDGAIAPPGATIKLNGLPAEGAFKKDFRNDISQAYVDLSNLAATQVEIAKNTTWAMFIAAGSNNPPIDGTIT